VTAALPQNGSPASATAHRKKVLLVDDHAVVRAGLITLIQHERDLVVCGEADTERRALEAVRRQRPDVAVVDWSLGSHDASRLVETMRADFPELPVLVLSIHDEALYAERALRAGASGYVMKQEATEKIVDAIRCVSTGRHFLSERAARSVSHARLPLAVKARLPGEPARDSPAAGLGVSIVIPVFNSERTIGPLVERLIAELEAFYILQIVLVDDGSRDASATVCEALHGRFPEIVDFVELARNFGEHNAVMAGLHCAEGDYCVIMDDDFQNPPAEVRTLIEEIRKGHDVVYVRYRAKRHSWFRNAGSQFHNWMATRVLGKPADLYLSSFKAMNRFLVREVIHYTGPFPYLDAIILRTTRQIGVVATGHEARREGKSGYTLGKLISLWGNMVVAFSIYPLRLLGLAGLIMTLIGVGHALYTVLPYVIPGFADPDAIQRLSASMWFFRGVHLLAIAIVGEYVGRIYRQLDRDPQFIIRDIQRHRRQTPG
jgi:DNA-binding NarL/FixJ family response regulator/glycosyltransferase involved in cell wall biosynthesis